MTMIELNAILYYADFLSMKETSTPVTDTCKYFFIHGNPMNSCYIAGTEPIYDPENQYFKQSKKNLNKSNLSSGKAEQCRSLKTFVASNLVELCLEKGC